MSIAFAKMTRYDDTISEQTVFVDGDDIALIVAERADANATRLGVSHSTLRRMQTIAYSVDFFVEGHEDRTFYVSDFANARAAHAAAKDYVRTTITKTEEA
jgi:hypothetical protein